MTAERQPPKESGGVRDAILDATESIMVEEGYAAVTSRRVAERAGLKSKLVHYYFRTMEDLFVAVYERSEKEFLRRHLEAATSRNPIRALWELSLQAKRTRLSQELLALGNHKKAIGKITARVIDQIQSINTAFIGKYLDELGVDRERYPPVVISYFINGVSRSMVTDDTLGLPGARAEIHGFVERMLEELEARRPAAASPAPTTA
jgi:TetR/AcrR family transcriptional regulator of autoinduction and epiphytic fitness